MGKITLQSVSFIGKIVNTVIERMGIQMPQFISGEYRGLHYKIVPKPWWRHALSLVKIYPPYMVGTPIISQIKVVKRDVEWHLNQLPMFVDYPGAKGQISIKSLRQLPSTANKGTVSGYDADGNFDRVFWIDVPDSIGAKRVASVRGHHNDAIYYIVIGAIISCVLTNLLPSLVKFLIEKWFTS